MSKKPFKYRYFRCPVCKSIQTATKSADKMTSFGHIKHMYCWACKEVRPFKQVSAWGDE